MSGERPLPKHDTQSLLRTSASQVMLDPRWTRSLGWRGEGMLSNSRKPIARGGGGRTDASSCPSAWSPHNRGQVAVNGGPQPSPQGNWGSTDSFLANSGCCWVGIPGVTPFCSRTESRLQGVIREGGVLPYSLHIPPVNLRPGHSSSQGTQSKASIPGAPCSHAQAPEERLGV